MLGEVLVVYACINTSSIYNNCLISLIVFKIDFTTRPATPTCVSSNRCHVCVLKHMHRDFIRSSIWRVRPGVGDNAIVIRKSVPTSLWESNSCQITIPLHNAVQIWSCAADVHWTDVSQCEPPRGVESGQAVCIL